MISNKIRAIAFYLPQFYPTAENDEWWEPGFTEWTNVARAKPLFKGHYQPRIPRDLGFYDLRVPETREKQAELAREAGIEGFCYWHYWFGNGKRLLDRVFREVVNSGKPDFPFCLCWANHSWYAKTWDPNMPDKLLMEQTYPGVDDYIAHFTEMLPAFKDERYMKTADGRLIFGIFAAHRFPNFDEFKNTWNSLAKENGLEGFWFFNFVQGENRLIETEDKGHYDAVVYDALADAHSTKKRSLWEQFKLKYHLSAYYTEYTFYIDICKKIFSAHQEYIPCVNPDFDHSPRSKYQALILHNSSPKLWGRLLNEVKALILSRKNLDNFIFIKAWNEWGEGNYMEPDHKWGKGYIEECGKVLK